MTQNGKHPILIVDDEPEMLYSLRGLLRRAFDVHTAESATAALEVLRQQPIHVIMTDQRMPEMTGVELLTAVQEAWPETMRIVFTGYADIKAVIDAINQGHIFRYITKPWDPHELTSILRQACDEYARVAERTKLLMDLRAYPAQCMMLVDGLQDGRLGRLSAEGQVAADQLAEEGHRLVERLNRALAQQIEEQQQR